MEAWRIFDTDSDGFITAKDLRTLMLSFGYDHSEAVYHVLRCNPDLDNNVIENQTGACSISRRSAHLHRGRQVKFMYETID